MQMQDVQVPRNLICMLGLPLVALLRSAAAVHDALQAQNNSLSQDLARHAQLAGNHACLSADSAGHVKGGLAEVSGCCPRRPAGAKHEPVPGSG